MRRSDRTANPRIIRRDAVISFAPVQTKEAIGRILDRLNSGEKIAAQEVGRQLS